MYRKKIMIISTVFIVGLLAVMIWSSNVVADNNAKQNEIAIEETDGKPEILDGDFAKEHLEDLEATPSETTEMPAVEQPKPPLVLDNTDLEPRINERLKPTARVGRNYVDKLANSPKLILWNKGSFPLNVYIKDETNWPIGFADGIKTALNNWQNASNNLVSFEYKFNSENADIIFEMVEKPADKCTFENEIEKVYDIKGVKLNNVTLKVPKVDCDGKDVNVAELYAKAQHHIGHILGIEGHSDSASDAMYPSISYENINITDIDVNTLRLLYTFLPDITNESYKQAEMTKMPRFSKIKGKSKEEVQQFLANNMVLETDKADPLDALLAEASTYYEKGNYRMAVTYYRDALAKAENNVDKAYVYRCLSITYLKMGGRNGDALINAKSAYGLSSTPINEYLIAYIHFTMGNQEDALVSLETILHDYPKIRQAYVLAAQIYEKKRQNIKLEELAKTARDNFLDNPPVIINK